MYVYFILCSLFFFFSAYSSDDDETDIGLPAASREEPSRLESVAEPEEEVPCIDVEIPRCLAKLGTDQYFVKLPNFLSIETR